MKLLHQRTAYCRPHSSIRRHSLPNISTDCTSQCNYKKMTDHLDPTKGGNTLKGILDILITMVCSRTMKLQITYSLKPIFSTQTESCKGFADVPRWIGTQACALFHVQLDHVCIN